MGGHPLGRPLLSIPLQRLCAGLFLQVVVLAGGRSLASRFSRVVAEDTCPGTPMELVARFCELIGIVAYGSWVIGWSNCGHIGKLLNTSVRDGLDRSGAEVPINEVPVSLTGW